MAKSKFYVVWEGNQPGVYNSWAQCQRQIEGYSYAKYKSYSSLVEAEQALADGWKKHWGQAKAKSGSKSKNGSLKEAGSATSDVFGDETIDYNSICVDVGTRGNPGPVEYKGVDTETEEVLFEVGPINKGTNNLGEFIAIVHGLAYLKKQGSSKTVYTDSMTAMKWIRNKQVATTLARDESTRRIWELTDRAIYWLQTNSYDNPIKKWNTEAWGEIKADYGRK